MKYLLLCLLPLFVGVARAQEAPVIAPDEIALEGRILGVDGMKNEVQLDATAFVASSGRRQTFSKSKPKTLQLLPETKLFDERLEKAGTLGDLKIGLLVRATGRDGGSGKPLVVRLLNWISPEAPDPDTPPALVPLLPPGITWHGTSFRIIDASFKTISQTHVLSNASDDESEPLWMMTWRAKPEGAVRLIDIQTPEEPLDRPTSQPLKILSDGTRVFSPIFSRVNPRWKSVRARFEITAADAPPDASGVFQKQIDISIPVPPGRNGVLAPHTQWRTPKGGTVELASVEAKDDVGHIRMTFRWTPPTSAPDARIECSLNNFHIDGDTPTPLGGSYSHQSYEGQKMEMHEFDSLPRTGPLRATLLIKESAASWRKGEFFRREEVDLPVSEIVAVSPPPRLETTTVPLQVETPRAIARLEGPYGHNLQTEAASHHLILWLSPKQDGEAPVRNGVEQRVLLRSVHSQLGGATPDDRTAFGVDGNTFWHADHAPAVAGETGWQLYIDGKGSGPLQLTATAQLASLFEGDHRFENIPIPARGETRELGEDWGDDVVNVRKIAWIEPGRWKDNAFVRNNIHYTIGERGALVVVYDLLHVWPNSEIHRTFFNFWDDAGTPYIDSDYSGWNGDVLDKGTISPTTISLVMAPPADGAKTVNFSFHLTENSIGPSQKFVFPPIRLNPEKP